MTTPDVSPEAHQPELLIAPEHDEWLGRFVDYFTLPTIAQSWSKYVDDGNIPRSASALADDPAMLALASTLHGKAVTMLHEKVIKGDKRYKQAYGTADESVVRADLLARVQQVDRHARASVLLPTFLRDASTGQLLRGNFDAAMDVLHPQTQHRGRLANAALTEQTSYLAYTPHRGYVREVRQDNFAYIASKLTVEGTPQSTLAALINKTEAMATTLASGELPLDSEKKAAQTLMSELAANLQASQGDPQAYAALHELQSRLRTQLGRLVERRRAPEVAESASSILDILRVKAKPAAPSAPPEPQTVSPHIIRLDSASTTSTLAVGENTKSVVIRPGKFRDNVKTVARVLGITGGVTGVAVGFSNTAAFADTGNYYQAAHAANTANTPLAGDQLSVSMVQSANRPAVQSGKAVVSSPAESAQIKTPTPATTEAGSAPATAPDNAPASPDAYFSAVTTQPNAAPTTEITDQAAPSTKGVSYTAANNNTVHSSPARSSSKQSPTAPAPATTEQVPMTAASNEVAQAQVDHDEFSTYIRGQTVDFGNVIQLYDTVIQQAYGKEHLVAANTPKYLASYSKRASDLVAAAMDPSNGLTAEQRADVMTHAANGYMVLKYPGLAENKNFVASLTPAKAAPELGIYATSIMSNYTSAEDGALGVSEGVQLPTMEAATLQLGYADAAMNTAASRLAALKTLDPASYQESVAATTKYLAAQRAAQALAVARKKATTDKAQAQQQAAQKKTNAAIHSGNVQPGQKLNSHQISIKSTEAMQNMGGDWVNRAIAMRYLMDKLSSLGFTNADIVAAGFGGNFIVESGTNPERVQDGFAGGPYSTTIPDSIRGGKGGYGLAQWTSPGRVEGLEDEAKNDPQHRPVSSLQLQLDDVWRELTSSYPGVMDRLRNATSPEQAASIVMGHGGDGYENPGTPNEEARRTGARAVYDQYSTYVNEIQAKLRQQARIVTSHPEAAKGNVQTSAQIKLLIQTAVKYAKTTTDFNDHVPDPDYLQVRRADYPGGPNDPWNQADTDCSKFIEEAVRHSVDPNWRGNSSGAIQYALQSSQWTVYKNAASTPGGIHPGDILANSQHIFMYVGTQANGFSVAEASWDEGNGGHVPEIDSNLYTSQGGEAFQVIRLTN